MEEKLLSIVVPVYNGGCRIADTLESVLVQLPEFKTDVEFLVRDNCSSDNTQQVISDYQQQYPNLIRYERRDILTIADNNFFESTHLAKGKYVLLLGDDDLLCPYFIYYTLKAIREYPNVGLIYYNRFSSSMSYKNTKIYHDDLNSCFKVFYPNIYDFFLRHIPGPNFISVNVFRKDCLMRGIPFVKKNYYGYLVYGAMLKGLVGESCLYYSFPGILQRNPQIRTWRNKALLYNSTGLRNIFFDLNDYYPGISALWEKHRIIYPLISTISKEKQLYIEKWPEIKPNLSVFQRLCYFLVLYVPYFGVIYNFMWRVFVKMVGVYHVFVIKR